MLAPGWALMWAPGCEDEEGPVPPGPGETRTPRLPRARLCAHGRVDALRGQHSTAPEVRESDAGCES